MSQTVPAILWCPSVPGAPLADVCTAVVFCGGRGLRLRAYERGIPKALVRLGERTYLDRLLSTLWRAGVRKVVLCVSKYTEAIYAEVRSGHAYGLQITYSGDSGLVENGGALWRALPHVGTPLMLCINGDTVVDLDVSGFLHAHAASGATASLVASSRRDQPHPGAVEVGPDRWVCDLHEEAQDAGRDVLLRRNARGLSNSGVYAMQPGPLRHDSPALARGGKIEERLLRNLAWRGELWSYENGDRYLLDLGVPERLEQSRAELDRINEFFGL
jgi:NDP-sugar pyrophosphorylase family protein